MHTKECLVLFLGVWERNRSLSAAKGTVIRLCRVRTVLVDQCRVVKHASGLHWKITPPLLPVLNAGVAMGAGLDF